MAATDGGQVRERYAAAAQAVTGPGGRTALELVDAAGCCVPAVGSASEVEASNASCCGSGGEVEAARVRPVQRRGAGPAARRGGAGEPRLRESTAVADMHEGERVLGLARANEAKAGATNVAFLHGTIEDIPLPDGSVDVVISNCVINLSADKPAVLGEMFRVLVPGGRIGVSDVVAEDQLSAADRAERGSYVGCIAEALSRTEYVEGLTEVGLMDASVEFTHEAVPGMHGAIVRATKPALVDMDTVAEASGRCSTDALASCCGGAIGYLAIRALYPAPPGVAADVADTDVTAIMDTASGVQRR